MKRVILSERQVRMLKNALNEESYQTNIVRQMKSYLDNNYTPVEKFVREGGEYFEKPMIEVKADGEIITPKSLYEYLKYKFKMSDDFTKQVIRDWMFGNIGDDFSLSKNVNM
jgi:hypothetical protein